MTKFDVHFKLDTENAIEYVKYLNIFPKNSKLRATEIGDGNINYIFKIVEPLTNKSVVLKQADKFLRSSGRLLDMDRNRIEAEILKIEKENCPNYIPEIYYYDDIMKVIVMEDISEYRNLRKELLKGKIYQNFAENISEFLVDSLLPTTDLVLDKMIKKDRVKKFINKELCDISESLVFTEPYTDERKRNVILKENLEFVEKNIYSDVELKREVAKLKNKFMNNAQALIHGDLHSGSIFINEKGIKIIDPEFSFYGPMGYDIGNVIGNLFFSYINRKYLMENNQKFLEWIEKTIINIFNFFKIKYREKYEVLVKDELYKNKEFEEWYLDEILSDALGMAGLEIIRRVIGDSKVLEVTSIENVDMRVKVERELLKEGIFLIKNREKIKEGKEIFGIYHK